MLLEHTTLAVPGLSKSLRLFHLTDMHLTEVNCQDSDYAKSHSIPRTQCFALLKDTNTLQIWNGLLKKSQELHSDCVVMTGDIIDFPSSENLKQMKSGLSQLPNYFYTVGNHDWCYPIYHPPTDETRRKFLPLVEEASGYCSSFSEKELDGLLFIGIDNGYYQVTETQYEKVEQALKRNMPTLLFCHVPLYCPGLCPDTEKVWHAPILMGCPEELYKGKAFGNNTLKPSHITAEFLNMLRKAKNLVAIIAGHVHFSHVDLFAPGKPQIVTGCAAYDTGRVIDLVKA